MITYNLARIDELLFTTGAIRGPERAFSTTFLVDTGSTLTLLPWELLATVGYNPPFQAGLARIVTASGIVVAPKVRVDWFSCCGFKFDAFPVVVHTLPSGLARFGILEMDFLRRAKARVDVPNAQLVVAA